MTPAPPTVHLVHLPRVTSTMDVLDDLIAAGAPDWTVVLADEQTAGRGRGGRTWEAAPGSALLCSILVRPRFPQEQAGMLALAVGVALADYLASLSVGVTLKWPNDVLLDGRKLAGILIRNRRGRLGPVANVGVGLNLRGTDRDVSRASLDEVVRGVPETERVVDGLVAHLARLIADGDASAVQGAWTSRAAFLGERVYVEHGTARVRGVLRGVDDRGALLIEGVTGELHTVVAGDVVRGPRVEEG